MQVVPSLSKQAGAFLESTLLKWLVPALVGPVWNAAGEMVTWLLEHGLRSPVTLTATMDHERLIAELGDRGGLVPDPHVSEADAESVRWLLEAPAVAWCPCLDSRCRRPWIAFSTETTGAVAPGDDFAEPLWL